jgi:signal transduction histidine kinase
MRTKILTVLFGVLLLNGLLAWGIHRWVVFPSYLELESVQAARDTDRCLEALERELHHLSGLAHDWAAWDDTYQFVQSPDPEYVSSNLVIQSFTDNRLNLLFIFDLAGRVVWGEARAGKSWDRIALPEFPEDALPSGHALFQVTPGPDAAVEGVMKTAAGPMLVASRPVTTSDHRGATRGFLVMGRLLSRDLAAVLETQTRVRHEYLPLDAPLSDPADRRALAAVNAGEKRPRIPLSEELLRTYAVLPDLSGSPFLLLRTEIPREIRDRGLATLRYGMLSSIGAGLLLLAVLGWLLQLVVVQPLVQLTRRVETIQDSDEIPPPVFEGRKDEIGVLCRAFNQLLHRLRDVNEGLRSAKDRLERENEESRRHERELIHHRSRLRALAAEALMAEERERRRIATQVHDRIGQHLAATRLHLGMLYKERPHCCLLDRIRGFESLIDQAIQDTRSLTFEISPPILYEMGPIPAVEWLVDEMAERHGLTLRFAHALEGEPLPEGPRVTAFQVLRELVFNVVKHAGVDSANVRLWREPGAVGLEVQDAGAGFSPERSNGRSNGFGLFSIRERMLSIGGRLDLFSHPGAGTRVRIKIPLAPVKEVEDWQ